MRCEYHQDTVQPCALPSGRTGSKPVNDAHKLYCNKQAPYALFLYNKTTPTIAKAII